MSTEQTKKCFVLVWGSYTEQMNRYSIDIETEIFIFETESTAIEGMREDLKARLLTMINFFLSSEENRNISQKTLCEISSILENYFNMLETIIAVDKANEIIESIIKSLRNLYEEEDNIDSIRIFDNLIDFLTIYSPLGKVSTGQYRIVEKVVDSINIPKDEKEILSQFNLFLFRNR